MTIKSIAVTDFMPPTTQWPAPTMPMPLDAETCLAYCEDGALLAIRYLDANEVLNKIPRDALFALCVALKQRSPWAYLIIGGGLEEATDGKTIASGGKRDWSWQAVQGALLSVQELGVAILHINDERELGAAVDRLGKRDRSTKRLAPQKTVDAMSVAEDMLLCLPGLGARHAHAVLADSGENFIWALIALVNSDCNVPGIGEKTRAKIRDALGLLPDQDITLIQPGDQIVPASAKEIAA